MGANQSSEVDAPLRQTQSVVGDEPSYFPPDDSLPPFITLKTRTHDTSPTNAHVPGISVLTEELLTAARKVWPTRHRARYADVRVLLLQWENDDLGVSAELKELDDTFRCLYGYNTERWSIPAQKPDRRLKKKITEFIDEYEDPDTLLIVYYGGHAQPNSMPGESPDWVSQRFDGVVVHAGGVQSLLEECDSDVLVLYDCCHAVHPSSARSYPQRTVVSEVLAACGFESTAADVGEHSFTKNLREVLAEAFKNDAEGGLKVVDIHTRLISRLQTHKSCWVRNRDGQLVVDSDRKPIFEPVKRCTPVHYWLSNNDRSIVIAPLARDETTHTPALTDASGSDTTTSLASSEPGSPGSKETDLTEMSDRSEPRVLITVRLAEDTFDVSTWLDWLTRMPKEAQELVSVEGIFGSFSTTVLLRVPVSIWDMLPECPAIAFIDFVTTENRLLDPGYKFPPGQTTKSEFSEDTRTIVDLRRQLVRANTEIDMLRRKEELQASIGLHQLRQIEVLEAESIKASEIWSLCRELETLRVNYYRDLPRLGFRDSSDIRGEPDALEACSVTQPNNEFDFGSFERVMARLERRLRLETGNLDLRQDLVAVRRSPFALAVPREPLNFQGAHIEPGGSRRPSAGLAPLRDELEPQREYHALEDTSHMTPDPRKPAAPSKRET